MPDPKIPGAVLLGPGKSRKYWRREYEGRLLEIGGETWLLPEGFFCECCEGSGCTACKWTGEEAKRQEIRHQRSVRKQAKKAIKSGLPVPSIWARLMGEAAVFKSESAQAVASSSHSPTEHDPPIDADKPDT